MSPNRPPRAPGFSYIGFHCYFLTICTIRRARWFEESEAAHWLTRQIPSLFEPRGFAVLAFCVMPDHVHLLLEGLTGDADLRAAVHDWKRRTGYAWKQRTGRRLWQQGFYDYVLRDPDRIAALVRYVVQNPIRAGLTQDVTRYPHAGSSSHSTIALMIEVAQDWEPPWKRRR